METEEVKAVELSDQQADDLKKNLQQLNQVLVNLTKSSREYRQAAEVFGEKAHRLVDDLKAYASLKGDKDPRTDKIIGVLDKIEKMKSALHEKTEVLFTVPIQSFTDTELKPVLAKDKEIQSLRKKKDEAQSKLKKQKDPYKMKQLETKFLEAKNQYDFQNLSYLSSMKDMDERKWFQINNWMMAYVFANLAFFRKGFEYLNDLENEMRDTTLDIAKKEDEVIERTEARISKLQSLHKERANVKKSETEKQGYLSSKGKPIWVTVSDGVFAYYKSWQEAIPLSSIDLMTATVKPSTEGKFFELISPTETLLLKGSSQEDVDSWLAVIRHGILTQLETHKKSQLRKTNTIGESANALVTQVYDAHESNSNCADCGAPNPDWASINIGCIICHECSGVHRKLGTHISKIRSLTLDKWEPQLFQLLKYMGNEAVNKVYEANIQPPLQKIKPEAERSDRELYITQKYAERKFVPPTSQSKAALSLEIYNVAVSSQPNDATVPAILNLIAQGADVNWPNEEENGTTPLHYFAAIGNLVGADLLIQNGANLNVGDTKGWTALHYAACHDHLGCVRLLINRSANQEAKDHEGKTPLQIAEANNSEGVIALLTAGEGFSEITAEDVSSSLPSSSSHMGLSPSPISHSPLSGEGPFPPRSSSFNAVSPSNSNSSNNSPKMSQLSSPARPPSIS